MRDFPHLLELRQTSKGKEVVRQATPRASLILLVEQLEIIRRACGGRSVTIVSGFRTLEYNRGNKGRASWSRHLFGQAADIRVKGLSPAAVFHVCRDLIHAGLIKRGGLAAYPTFTHYDTRGWNARWRPTPKRPKSTPYIRTLILEAKGQ